MYKIISSAIQAHREFSKPLNVVADFPYLPDFVLHDTETPTAMVVFGMMNLETYQHHAEVKTTYYHARHISL